MLTRLLFLLATLLLGCTAPPDPQTLRLGLANAPVNLDPRFATDAASARVIQLLYRDLVEFDAADRPVPGLADWTNPSPDQYLFCLRPVAVGREFSHGRRLVAEDVRATLASILDPATASPFRTQLARIRQMEVVDEDRVRFLLDRPDPLFPAALALPILPADLLSSRHPFNRLPVGSGPLRLLEWPQPGRLVLERRADSQRLELVEARDPGVRVMKLLRGEINLLQGELPPELFRVLRARPQVQVIQAPGSNFTYLGFNLEDPALARLGVRQAIAHAIDRGAIIRYLLGGAARPAQALLRPEHWAGAPGLAAYAYDPDRSRRLLRAAGYDQQRPLHLEFKTSTDPVRLRLATLIQAQLEAAGIQVRVRSLDWGTFYGDVKAGRFQLFSLAWIGVRTPDQFRYLFHSHSVPPDGANRGRYRNPRVDVLIEQAESQPSVAEQAPLYRDLQRLLLADLPYVPLWYEDQVAALRREVGGYRLTPDGRYEGLTTLARQPRETAH